MSLNKVHLNFFATLFAALFVLHGCSVVNTGARQENTPYLLLSGTVDNPESGRGGARNIILIIGDGMQLEHERAAGNYLFGNYSSGLTFHKFPYKGQSSTWDVTTYNKYAKAAAKAAWDNAKSTADDMNSFERTMGYDPGKGGKLSYPLDKTGDPDYLNAAATDSASAATALATGHKTDDGNISWKPGDPEKGRLLTIAEMFRHQRKGAIGVVSTVPFSHATPAAFVSHNKYRRNYKQIADEIINAVKPEVVIGGGHPSYNTSFMSGAEFAVLKGSGEYMLAERKTGVDGNATVSGKAAEAVARGKKLFGLFGNNKGQFDSPVPSNSIGSPKVIRGNIENPSLAEASKAALRVLSRNRNGFFLMIEQGDIDWANHANDFKGMIGGVYDLNEAVKAIESYIGQPDDDIDWSNTMVIVTSDHGNGYMRINSAKPMYKGELPRQVATGFYKSGFIYPDREVSYGSSAHTNELTRVYAKGAGSNLFGAYEGSWYPGTKIIDNTQIFKVMMTFLGLTDQNR